MNSTPVATKPSDLEEEVMRATGALTRTLRFFLAPACSKYAYGNGKPVSPTKARHRSLDGTYHRRHSPVRPRVNRREVHRRAVTVAPLL